jgi:hypothetical protein
MRAPPGAAAALDTRWSRTIAAASAAASAKRARTSAKAAVRSAAVARTEVARGARLDRRATAHATSAWTWP